ncbi:30S ribosomal protein S6 [Dermacoccus nishinomiyaensis]|uniref:30S ribosomal protein S6 n=1 Tax=Dermacoccus nishinomiyaensis TaxID=1274 RepID=UPI0021B51C6E|nr:30S ribosomal protein S6 [Dermacoccus nishinomiyaensis]
MRKDGGMVDKVEVWGRGGMGYEMKKKSEGMYVVVELKGSGGRGGGGEGEVEGGA